MTKSNISDDIATIHSLRAKLEVLSLARDVDEGVVQSLSSSLVKRLPLVIEDIDRKRKKAINDVEGNATYLYEFLLKPILLSARECHEKTSIFVAIESIIKELHRIKRTDVTLHLVHSCLKTLLEIIRSFPESASRKAWDSVKACVQFLNQIPVGFGVNVISAVDVGLIGLKNPSADVRKAAVFCLGEVRRSLSASKFAHARGCLDTNISDLIGLIDTVLRRHSLYDESYIVREAILECSSDTISKHTSRSNSGQHQTLSTIHSHKDGFLMQEDPIKGSMPLQRDRLPVSLNNAEGLPLFKENDVHHTHVKTCHSPTETFDSPNSAFDFKDNTTAMDDTSDRSDALSAPCDVCTSDSFHFLDHGSDAEVQEFLRGSIVSRSTFSEVNVPFTDKRSPSLGVPEVFSAEKRTELTDDNSYGEGFTLLLQSLKLHFGDNSQEFKNLSNEDKDAIRNIILDLYAEAKYDELIRAAEISMEQQTDGVSSMDSLRNGEIIARTKILEAEIHDRVAQHVESFCTNRIPSILQLLEDEDILLKLIKENAQL